MRANLLAILVLLLAITHTPAQQTVADWQREATEAYPALATKDSALNRLFVSEYTRLKQDKPAFFSDPQWPMVLAQQCAERLQPKQTAGATSGLISPAPAGDTSTVDLKEKLKRIILPRIDFKNATVQEAVDYLVKASAEVDSETDPVKKGVKIRLRLIAPGASTSSASAPALPNGTPPINPHNTRINLSLRNVPLGEALRYIASLAELKVRVNPAEVELVSPQLEEGVLVTKEYSVPLAALRLGKGDVKPKDVLIMQGVKFPAGAAVSFSFSDSTLIVRNTQEQIDLIDAFVEYIGGHPTLKLKDKASVSPNPASPVDSTEPDKPKSIKVECRLLEMPFQQADAVEATLQRWNAYPAEQTHQLDGILWGTGAKKLAEFTGSTTPGAVFKSGGMEFDVLMCPNATCDLNFRTSFDDVSSNTNTLTSTSEFSARNGIPVVLSRINLGNQAGIVVVRCSWDSNVAGSPPASPAASEKQQAWRSPTVNVECSLVEMPSGLADAVESASLRWILNPPEQARQVDAILNGAGVKRIEILNCAGKSGQRSVIANLARPLIYATGARRNIGATFEIEPTVGSDNFTCDLNCVFQRVQVRDGPSQLETVKPTTSVTTFNGLPVVLARRDFGHDAELVIAKATWGDPTVARPAAGGLLPMNVHVRAKVVSVSAAIASEADKIRDNPKALADWLKKRGATQAVIGITTKSGQRAVFEHVFEERFLFPNNTYETYNIGTEIEVEPIMGPDNRTMDLVANVKCCQPKDSGGLLGSPISGRYIHTEPAGVAVGNPNNAQRRKTLTIADGESAAIPCLEYKDIPSKEAPDGLHKDVSANDVFIVFDRVLPDNAASGPHFFNTN